MTISRLCSLEDLSQTSVFPSVPPTVSWYPQLLSTPWILDAVPLVAYSLHFQLWQHRSPIFVRQHGRPAFCCLSAPLHSPRSNVCTFLPWCTSPVNLIPPPGHSAMPHFSCPWHRGKYQGPCSQQASSRMLGPFRTWQWRVACPARAPPFFPGLGTGQNWDPHCRALKRWSLYSDSLIFSYLVSNRDQVSPLTGFSPWQKPCSCWFFEGLEGAPSITQPWSS